MYDLFFEKYHFVLIWVVLVSLKLSMYDLFFEKCNFFLSGLFLLSLKFWFNQQFLVVLSFVNLVTEINKI
jgi:hypothetical protein